jgi:PhnB protein
MTAQTPDPASPVREVYPYLRVRGAAAAIDFYTQVFGARELFRLTDTGGRVGHAQLELGPATLMLSDEHPEHGILSPLAFGGTGMMLHLHVDNVDALAERAVAAGATLLMEPTDQPHGERQCRLRDPFGHEWLLGHEIEKLSPEEIQQRYAAATAGEYPERQ